MALTLAELRKLPGYVVRANDRVFDAPPDGLRGSVHKLSTIGLAPEVHQSLVSSETCYQLDCYSRTMELANCF